MHGLITTRHLLTCAPTIIGAFGVRAYLRCLVTVLTPRREAVTFLQCVVKM